jgi:hypothetical protein
MKRIFLDLITHLQNWLNNLFFELSGYRYLLNQFNVACKQTCIRRCRTVHVCWLMKELLTLEKNLEVADD